MEFKRIVMSLACPLLLSGCFASYGSSGKLETCERAIKQYNTMLRWQEGEKAAQVFVEDSQREGYAQAISAMRRRGVSIADLQILTQQCLPDQQQAQATVELYYLFPADSRLKMVTDHQRWIFSKESVKAGDPGQGWKLVSPLPDFK